MDHPYTEARKEYLILFADALIAWNQAEMLVRRLLSRLIGNDTTSIIMTSELNSRGITYALNSLSELQDEQVGNAIRVVAKYYDSIKDYRNYYVHGIVALGYAAPNGEQSEKASGLIYMASSKGKLKVTLDHIGTNHLKIFRERTEALQKATGNIIDFAFPGEGSAVNPPLPTSQSLPQPPNLQKPILYPLGTPQGSQKPAA